MSYRTKTEKILDNIKKEALSRKIKGNREFARTTTGTHREAMDELYDKLIQMREEIEDDDDE